MHEAKLHPHNCWITLTYKDTALPSKYHTGLLHPVTQRPIYGGTLRKSDVQKFLRKVRKYLTYHYDGKILHSHTTAVDYLADKTVRNNSTSKPTFKYYYAGEYGEKYKRPHYHLCLFGIDFADKKLLKHTAQQHGLYESELLKTLWPHGDSIVTDLTWQTAAYTARYSMAKVNGMLAERLHDVKPIVQHQASQKQHTENEKTIKTIKLKHYQKLDYETGEIITLEPEYNDMSRKPGIGFYWLQKWESDVYKTNTSHVRIRGNKTQPPRYYDKLHKKNNPQHYEHIKKERAKATALNWLNNLQPRLDAEEIITTRKIKTLKQRMETT